MEPTAVAVTDARFEVFDEVGEAVVFIQTALTAEARREETAHEQPAHPLRHHHRRRHH